MLKRWVPASFIAVAMALALAGGAVLAVGATHGADRSDVFDRAAEILGIDPLDLHAAHDQASRESQDEQIAAIIEHLVASEVIDQAEADSFNSWMADRPDSADEKLFSQITSSLPGSPWIKTTKIELHRLPGSHESGLHDRMAELLGIDPEALTEALESSSTELAEQSRLDKLHAVVDAMLENGDITTVEADELSDWIDATPQWVLDFDVSTQLFPSLNLFGDHGSGFDFLKRLPFGGPERPHRGDREFHFEFRGPKGEFKFGPGEHDFPFDEEGLDELLEGFELRPFGGIEGLENLEGFEGLFERFEGHPFFESPFRELDPPTIEPDTNTTST